jgi:hypothetical protein
MLDSDNLDAICTSSSLLFGFLSYVESTGSITQMGVRGFIGAGRSGIRTNSTNNQIFSYSAGPEAGPAVDTLRTGIYVSSRTTSASHTLRVRRSTGVTSLLTESDPSVTLPSRAIAYLAENNNFAISGFCNGSFGAFFIGDGLSNDDTDKFTAALETLWETTTGLTLP